VRRQPGAAGPAITSEMVQGLVLILWNPSPFNPLSPPTRTQPEPEPAGSRARPAPGEAQQRPNGDPGGPSSKPSPTQPKPNTYPGQDQSCPAPDPSVGRAGVVSPDSRWLGSPSSSRPHTHQPTTGRLYPSLSWEVVRGSWRDKPIRRLKLLLMGVPASPASLYLWGSRSVGWVGHPPPTPVTLLCIHRLSFFRGPRRHGRPASAEASLVYSTGRSEPLSKGLGR